eukprot:c8609_g1_i1.p1 GENE.c8609_g1_i1~~c8609_g1_i1.p1  ORF type:complete len:552 (-),score=143.32 c8609_g1_i1:52-1707(-)
MGVPYPYPLAMGKKKFIEKKNAAVYQVVHSSYGNRADDSASSIFLKPVRQGAKAAAAQKTLNASIDQARTNLSATHRFGDEDDEDDDEIEGYGEEGFDWEDMPNDEQETRSVAVSEVSILREVAERSGFEGRYYDANGLLIDGYDYSRHLKPIGDDPSAVFLLPGGIAVGAKDVVTPKHLRIPNIQEERFDVLLPALPTEEIDEDVLAAMELIENEDIDPEEEWGGPLADDFILQATGGKNYHDLVESELLRTADEIEEDEEYEESPVHRPADYHPKLIDERFDEVLKEYDDDQIGELDDENVENIHGLDVSHFSDVIDGFLRTGPYKIFKNPDVGVGMADIPIGKFSGSAKDESPFEILDAMRKQAKEEGLAELIESAPEESVQDLDATLDALLQKPLRTEWDCETILSTYSNTENHPKYVSEPSNIKIKLDKRTGLPVTFKKPVPPNKETQDSQPPADSPATDAKQAEEGNNSDSDGSGEEDETVTVVNSRSRTETAEEKRARKRAVKELKRTRRQQKKETANQFKDEQQRQVQNVLSNNANNPARIRL